MLYTEVLAKYGLTEETVSHTLKVKIKRYKKLEAAIADAKEKLPEAKSARKKIELENEIQLGEENLTAMNEEICPMIDKFFANRDINAKRAQQLADAKKAKTNPPAPAPTPAPTPTPTPAKTDGDGDDKKGSNVLAVVGSVILVGVLAFFGIRKMTKDS